MKRMFFVPLTIAAATLAFTACKEDVDPFQPVTPDHDCPVIMTELDGSKDMIELYNPGKVTESLEGFKIRRMRVKDGIEDEQTIWSGKKDVFIEAGKYLVLRYEEGKEDNNVYPTNLQNPFSSHKNLNVWFQDPQGKVLSTFVRGEKNIGWGLVGMQKCETEAGEKYSYSLVDGKWVYALPTPGAANGPKAGDIDRNMFTVVINEIDFAHSTIELFNVGKTPVDIKGFQLRWSRLKETEADNMTVWEATDATVIQPGAYLSVTSRVDLAGFTDRNVHIKFRDQNKTDFTGAKLTWDDFKRGTKGGGWTSVTVSPKVSVMARIPDGTGLWYVASKATPGATNGKDVSGGLVPGIDQD